MNLFLTRVLDPCPKVDQTVPVRVRAEAINGRPGGRSGFSVDDPLVSSFLDIPTMLHLYE